MKCRLCERPTTPGTGKLCLDCTKALHRARAGTPSVRKPPTSPTAQAEGMAITGRPLTVTPTSVLAPGWRRYPAWAAAGLVAIGIVYAAQSGPDPRRALDAVVVDAAPASSAERSQVDATAVSAPSETASSTAQAVAAEIPGTAPRTKAELNGAKAPSPPGAKTTPRAGTASTNANRDSSTSSTVYAVANDAATSKSKAQSEPETSHRLAQAKVSQTGSPTDGAQALASGVEQCGKEGVLTRFICEQKMYMQYCEDKWDKDPRCMRKTANN